MKFTSRVNLVPVTVVVRDSRGQAIGNLTKDDFRLFDSGKPQVITRFSVEKPAAPIIVDKDSLAQQEEPAKTPPGDAARPAIANHFAAYLFDDLHAKMEDLSRARDAAAKLFGTSLQPSDRAAIYTTSGQITQEFTSDVAALQNVLLRLRPVSGFGGGSQAADCPDISYYMADRILNHSDRQVLQIALAEYQACSGNERVSESEVMMFAQRALTAGEHGTRLATGVLNQVVRRLASMPGQRSLVLVSPGFLVPFVDHSDVTEIINRAVRAGILIGTLDARGLWTSPGYEASRPTTPGGGQVISMISSYLQEEAQVQEDVLAELADGTGGTFFHNNNDLGEGFRRLAAAPEYVYVLGFTPDSLKSNGKFHPLKVALREGKGLTVQARKGYYAPRRDVDAAEQAKQDIQDAVFSREVLKEIPIAIHTQFFKPSDFEARLSVLTQIDVRNLHFRKEEGRNRNDLTVAAVVFDINGNLVAGDHKVIELRLKDGTLENKLGSGIRMRSSFDVKTGSYVVRIVVRDSEGQLMASENGAVEIP